MQQVFIVYVREKYKNYSSLFMLSNTSYEESGDAIVFTGYAI